MSRHATSYSSPYDSDSSSIYSDHKMPSNATSTSSSKRWLPALKSSPKTTKPKRSHSSPPSSNPPTSSPQNTPSQSKKSKAWASTKKFLSSIGEPPTAEYDRQQALKDAQNGTSKIRTSGRDAFGAVNYGPYGMGGPFGASSRL